MYYHMHCLSVFAAFCVAPFEGVTFFGGFCTGCLQPAVPMTNSSISAQNTTNATTISTVISAANTSKRSVADDITRSMWLQPARGGNLRMLRLMIIMYFSKLFTKIFTWTAKLQCDNLVKNLDLAILALHSLVFSRAICIHVAVAHQLTVIYQANAIKQVCVPKLSPRYTQPSKYPKRMKRVRALCASPVCEPYVRAL